MRLRWSKNFKTDTQRVKACATGVRVWQLFPDQFCWSAIELTPPHRTTSPFTPPNFGAQLLRQADSRVGRSRRMKRLHGVTSFALSRL